MKKQKPIYEELNASSANYEILLDSVVAAFMKNLPIGTPNGVKAATIKDILNRHPDADPELAALIGLMVEQSYNALLQNKKQHTLKW